jgi:acyl-CoA thioester hydrolase
VAYPEKLDVGLRVSQLGNSSVRYELGVFRQGHVQASAVGHFVHVFVDRVSRKPTPIPERLRAALATLLPAN